MTESNAAAACFHCGEPVPVGAKYFILYQGANEPACCLGCQAVAQTIIDSGNADYYRMRTDLPKTAEAALEELKNLKLYDLPEVQNSFVKSEGDVREANLILEGIVCAACVWLNERHLHSLPGVLAADINFSTRRARVSSFLASVNHCTYSFLCVNDIACSFAVSVAPSARFSAGGISTSRFPVSSSSVTVTVSPAFTPAPARAAAFTTMNWHPRMTATVLAHV